MLKAPLGSLARTHARQLYSRGPLVDLLIATDVSRYLEFKVLDRTFLRLNNAWETVPSSKEDVFQSRLIGVVEKRVLMKFLTFCLTYQTQPAEYAGNGLRWAAGARVGGEGRGARAEAGARAG